MALLSSAAQGRHAGQPPARGLWRRWALATMLGELVGFLPPALAGVLVTRAVAGEGGAAMLLVPLALVAAGSLEGAALGYAQWRALRRALPAVGWRSWTGATALAAALAWALGMLPNTLADAAGLGMGGLALAWAAVAPGLLLSIGAAQWLVLRRHLAGAAPWVPANALAWALGVSLPFLGASLVSEAMPLWMAVGLGVASGVGMGLVVGCITGWVLVRLLRQAARAPLTR